MKVKELIEKLKGMDENLTVFIPVTEEEYLQVTSVDTTELTAGDDEEDLTEIVVCILNPDREA